VGNAHGGPHTLGLKFWAHGEPLSQGGLLDDIAAALPAQDNGAIPDRPARSFGPLRHFAAAEVYFSDLRPAFHALRPLRFVLDCTTAPVVAYLKELIRNVACQIIPGTPGLNRLETQVVAAQAHFGMRISDDGENCRVVDERGQSIEAGRLLALLAGNVAASVVPGEELRQRTFLQMRESGAAIAADAAGRLWYAGSHAPLPDALRTLTFLLVLLSRNDLAFSAVLAR
jgi:phosphomannomutase